MIEKLSLQTSVNGLLNSDTSLHDKNWFATGGCARFFAQPTTDHEFQILLQYAHQFQLPLFVLGQGANILISDDGFDGLVIRPHLKNIQAHEVDSSTVLVTSGSGVTMADLITWCLDRDIIGLEEFSGIPGTIGGSVFINLHYFEFLLSQFLLHARVIHKQTGEIVTVEKNWFEFGYNKSRLQHADYFLLDATFALKKVSPLECMYARGRSREIIRHRQKRYPTAFTCGSFFRNFHEDEVTFALQEKKIIFVAYYLDKIGIKGALRYGGAHVSHQHANMIVNGGNATSHDIIMLARTMQELVYKHFGIIPQSECILVGFREYPLIKG